MIENGNIQVATTWTPQELYVIMQVITKLFISAKESQR